MKMEAPSQRERNSNQSLPEQSTIIDNFRDEPGGTMGTEDLCAWKNFGDVYIIQTRNPDYARKLSRRSDTSRMHQHSVWGGYLRFYSITAKRRSKVRNLLKRYLKVTNEQFSADKMAVDAPKHQIGIKRLDTAGHFAVTNEHFSALTTPADTPKRQVRVKIAGNTKTERIGKILV